MQYTEHGLIAIFPVLKTVKTCMQCIVYTVWPKQK